MSAPFTDLQNCQAGIVLKGIGGITPSGFQNEMQNSMDAGAVTAFSKGTGAKAINKIFDKIFTIAAGATVAQSLNAAMTDLLNQASGTLASISAICIQLLSTAQDAVNGTDCSSITIGADATHPWDSGPFGATDTYTINNGGVWFHKDDSAAGMSVTSTDVLQIVNNDGTNAGAYRLTIFGRDA